MVKYKVILADPPWQYRDKARAGERGAEYKYTCMSEIALREMRYYIPSISDIDCTLLLWSTMPMLPVCLSVIDAWGYKYKTVAFTWVKTTSCGCPAMGMGHWTRSNAELCLLATRGKPKRVSKSVHSVIMSPRREHSRKPDEAYERIEQLFGDVPRIELFARQRWPGWDAVGDEVGKFDAERR